MQCLFPIALGFARILIVSSLDYQEHSSEYGTHWNFFTTIALVSILLVALRNPDHALPIAFVMMFGYELLIKQYGLDQYVFYAPRQDFISANREGITTLIGYLSLQMIGVGLGNFMFKQILTSEQLKLLRQRKEIQVEYDGYKGWKLFYKLSFMTVVFYGAYLLSADVFAPASRRLCNLAFVLYHAACVLAGCAAALLTVLLNSE